MRTNRIIITAISILLFSVLSSAQDNRSVETKVADLLAQMPSRDAGTTEKLMHDMLSFGDAAIKQICNQVVPAGTGDDTRPRFAIESLSRYLSRTGKDSDRVRWEKICISYATEQKDYTVKDFFLKQLQLVGTDTSVEAVKGWLTDKNLCAPVLGVISSVKSELAEKTLAESLRNNTLPCASAVMNSLAEMQSEIAINEYIAWSANSDKSVRASAYNAMAVTGNKLAYPVLIKAAKSVKYRWEHSEATASLLKYADAAGSKGDIRSMESVCKLLLKNCNEKSTIQYKTGALRTIVKYNKEAAFNEILKAASHPDDSYRNAAISLSLGLPGDEITERWLEYYAGATAAAKPEIIRMLGVRKDKKAVNVVTAALSDADVRVRNEAAFAIIRLEGRDADKFLVDYMLQFTGDQDQECARNALVTVLDSKNLNLMIPVLRDGPPASKRTAIEIIEWSRNSSYFSQVIPFATSENENVRAAACKALSSIAGPGDQEALISLINTTDDPVILADLQSALSYSAGQIADQEKRAEKILGAMQTSGSKEKFIPVLGNLGGRIALATVLKEFENGNAAMRDVCFDALTSWKDYTASTALYDIISSGNKTFEAKAFDGYLKQVKSARITDDQKLLLYRKIMPFALDAGRKNRILNELAGIKTYQCLFFTGQYLDDQEVSASAAHAVMYIALPSADSQTGMSGSAVRELLSKSIPLLKGPESDYDREVIRKYLASMPGDEGFVKIFNGKDLSGWQGLVENPPARAKMKPAELARKQAEADKDMLNYWSVRDGMIWFNGKGANLCTIKEYGDFEMLVDWRITKKGDSGIYLRGTPQVQIWDTSRVEVGAQVGSGGLYNNQKNESKPLVVADNPIGDWNSFRIVMIGEKVSVWLNGILVVDDVVMENYWERGIPIYPKGAIELQAHGTDLAFRDVYVREINEKEYNLTDEEKKEGFFALFNGRNLDNWTGDKTAYVVEDGIIVIKPDKGSGGNLFTEKEYSDFVLRFEFQLTPAANNGLGIRAPLKGDAAYAGMELQILDDTAPVYSNLQPYQYHGSVYGVIPSRRGYLKPVGDWNYQEVIVRGTAIKVILNGTVIVDGDIAGPRDNGTMDKKDHPGLSIKTGHVGFLGHGSVVKFRNIRIKEY